MSRRFYDLTVLSHWPGFPAAEMQRVFGKFDRTKFALTIRREGPSVYCLFLHEMGTDVEGYTYRFHSMGDDSCCGYWTSPHFSANETAPMPGESDQKCSVADWINGWSSMSPHEHLVAHYEPIELRHEVLNNFGEQCFKLLADFIAEHKPSGALQLFFCDHVDEGHCTVVYARCGNHHATMIVNEYSKIVSVYVDVKSNTAFHGLDKTMETYLPCLSCYSTYYAGEF